MNMIWLKGLLAAVISAVSGALLVTLSDYAAGTAIDFKKIGMVALIAALVGAAGYLKQSPIPPSENKL